MADSQGSEAAAEPELKTDAADHASSGDVQVDDAPQAAAPVFAHTGEPDGAAEPRPRLFLDKFAEFVASSPGKMLFAYLDDSGKEVSRLTYSDVDTMTRNLATHLRFNTSAG